MLTGENRLVLREDVRAQAEWYPRKIEGGGMANKDVLERIEGMSAEEKKKLVEKIGKDARDWELDWGG